MTREMVKRQQIKKVARAVALLELAGYGLEPCFGTEPGYYLFHNVLYSAGIGPESVRETAQKLVGILDQNKKLTWQYLHHRNRVNIRSMKQALLKGSPMKGGAVYAE